MDKRANDRQGGGFEDSIRTSYSLRLGAFYGALFLVYGVHLPYLPVWLDWRGLTAEQIAVVTAAPFFLRVFITPSVAMLADRTGQHRSIVNGLAWLVLVLALLLTQMESFWTIFLLALPFAISLSTIVPLTETIAVAGVRAHGLDYGRMRLWGSITFVVAGFIGGWLIDHTSANAVIGCILAGAVAIVGFAWLLPQPGASPPMARGGSLEEAGKLVSSPVFLAFLVAAGCAQGAHGMFYTFGALSWHAQGISTAWVGTLWAIAIVGEVALFAYSGNVVRRWGPEILLVAATAAAMLRWAAMSLSPPLAALIPLQTLHTLTYGASHLGAMHFISRAVPESAQGTAQALYATVASGLLMGGATLTSGWLYARVGGHAYLAMAALAAIGFAGALFVRVHWRGGALWQAPAAA
ncbi:MFS transporter [Hyphomicrobium sp.]|uniref:MFS transporter n=1 Tax=Hyphomicrobium sp. TaxID=82 RepID=UPI002E33BF6D|nr:MFS transporter [Hyphomicrobium sp.]HEX2843031.1 MFS transporter [Hyphomicrobium sp.]